MHDETSHVNVAYHRQLQEHVDSQFNLQGAERGKTVMAQVTISFDFVSDWFKQKVAGVSGRQQIYHRKAKQLWITYNMDTQRKNSLTTLNNWQKRTCLWCLPVQPLVS